MPDKPLTIASYAAGASLAAITLVYVFGPTFFIEEDTSSSSRKKGVVGLSNPANDCFINSTLQALAGLPDLRLYLVRETYRRKLDGPELYSQVTEEALEDAKKKGIKTWKLEGLQSGLVTYALKEILDRLNERPIYRKVISAQTFVAALEKVFRTRISRQQQDAQEFLQIVTERLCEEYHAGKKVRRKATKPPRTFDVTTISEEDVEKIREEGPNEAPRVDSATQSDHMDKQEEEFETDEEQGFPFEGKMESQIECMTCHFKPKPTASTFTTLSLSVPQKSATSLNSCFDQLLKVEHIDDYKCDYCRLQQAVEIKRKELDKNQASEEREQLESDIAKLEKALEEDPETAPEGVELPDSKVAPKRKIQRHMRISAFPKTLAIHLSRSIYSATSLSTKNMAKVAFPESLSLGELLDRKCYKLLATVTHKGGHNSGHYESFRRQLSMTPYSTPHSFGTEGVYSTSNTPNVSTMPSAMASPRVSSVNLRCSADTSDQPSPIQSDPNSPAYTSQATPSITSLSSRSSLSSRRNPNQQKPAPTSTPRQSEFTEPQAESPRPESTLSKVKSKTPSFAEAKKKVTPSKKKKENRWWRISDDKIKECKTSDTLGMQKEVYLLFYELERRPEETVAV